MNVVYIPQMGNYVFMDEGIFDEISSFIAYAQSLFYHTRATVLLNTSYLSGGMNAWVSEETRSLHFCLRLCLPPFYDARAANGLVRLYICPSSSEL